MNPCSTISAHRTIRIIRRVTRRQLFGTAAHRPRRLRRWPRLLGEQPRPRPQAAGAARACRISPRRPNASISSGRAAGRRTSICSTPSRCCESMAMQDIPDSVRGTTRLSTMSVGYKKWPIVPAIKPFKKWGKCGIEISTMLPAHRLHRRRHLRRPLHAHRGRQPRPRRHVFPDRLRSARPPQHGRVAHLRPWQRHRAICPPSW